MKSALEFIKESSFKYDTKSKQKILLQYFNIENNFHYKNNILYRKIVDAQFNGQNYFNNLNEIPFLPVQYFKESGKDLTTSKKIHRKLYSSATSGVPSIINIDNETSKRQIYSLTSTLSNFIGKSRREFLISDIAPNISSSEISARNSAVSGFINFSSKTHYIFNYKNNIFSPNINQIKKVIENSDSSLVICGFTFLLYKYLIKYCLDNKITLSLPPDSYIIHIGGWKKLIDESVNREKFINETSKIFNINTGNIIDIYGFTEQMGTIYPECKYGFKHVPDHAHLIVRNPYSYKVLNNEIGVGQFLSLVPKSYVGFSLLTDDLIQIAGENNCNCGRKGTYFKVIGRAKSAEIRGCGDVIATKITEATKIKTNKIKSVVHYFRSKKLNSKILNWDEYRNNLLEEGKVLAKLNTDEIILLLREAAKKWMQDKLLSNYKFEGIEFIYRWILSGELEKNLDLSLRGSKSHLDSLIINDIDHKKLIALPRGLVVHWVSGNVPTLGIISLIISLLCKNSNIVKVANNSPDVLIKMIEILSKIKIKNINKKELKGTSITNSLMLLYVDRESEDNENLSKLADVRIAWGGAEAVESIMNLTKKYNCEDIVFGPKLSLSAIGKESLQIERKVSRIVRSVAIDSSIFDQKACASSHNVFLEKGGKVSSDFFIEQLSKKMDEIALKIPGDENDFIVFDNIKSARFNAFKDNKIKILAPNNLKWTIIFDKKLHINQPIFGRTIFVHEIEDLGLLANLLSSDNQVVGLEINSFRRDILAKSFLAKGVSRITSIGHMANFTFPWDDIFPTEKLIRWCYA